MGMAMEGEARSSFEPYLNNGRVAPTTVTACQEDKQSAQAETKLGPGGGGHG
jgi:hypothetical protein